MNSTNEHSSDTTINFLCDVDTKNLGMLAFYYPGRETEADKRCYSKFLGNFYESPVLINGERYRCAEAAYQASKIDATLRVQFAEYNGTQAFIASRKMKCKMYTPEQAWSTMFTILDAKFKHPQLALMLDATKNTFLLEHNERVGRDIRWSNNGNGTGSNWLGLQLMILRDKIRLNNGNSRDQLLWLTWSDINIDCQTGKFFPGKEDLWMDIVLSATYAIKRELNISRTYWEKHTPKCANATCKFRCTGTYKYCSQKCASEHRNM